MSVTPPTNALGPRLRRARERRGLTPEDLGALLASCNQPGLTMTAAEIIEIEAGRLLLTRSQATHLARSLDIRPGRFLAGGRFALPLELAESLIESAGCDIEDRHPDRVPKKLRSDYDLNSLPAPLRLRWHYRLLQAHLRLSLSDFPVAALIALIAEAAELPDSEMVARLTTVLANYYYRNNRFEEADVCFRRVLDEIVAGEIRDTRFVLWAYVNLANNSVELGAVQEAINFLETAITISQDTAEDDSKFNLFWAGGRIYRFQGNHARSKFCWEQAINLGIRLGFGIFLAHVRVGYGVTLRILNDLEAAAANFYAALDIYQQHGDRAGIGMAYVNLADILVARGDLEKAKPAADEALAVLQGAGDIYLLAQAYVLTGEIAYIQEDRSLVDGSFQQAMQLLDQPGVGDLTRLGNIYNRYGQILMAWGETERAAAAFQRAFQLRK